MYYGYNPNGFRSYGSGGMSGLNLKMCATQQLIFQLHVGASIYMRVSISAFRPKKTASGLFCMFQLTPPVRAKPYQLNNHLYLKERAVVYAIGPGTHGGGERPECPSPVPPAQGI